MKIKSIEHALVRVPFTEDILWGSGRRIGTTRLICKITTDNGITGWGETLCLIDPVQAVFASVIEKIAVGYRISDVEKFHRHIMGAGYYHHKRAAVMAIAAAEMAMWDALGKQTGLPLWALWGGKWRNEVSAAAYLFSNDSNVLKNKIQDFLDSGFKTFKVKIGFDETSDIKLAEAARAEIGDLPLRLDVNGAWRPGTAKRMLNRLAKYDPAYVEQPLELDDLQGHAALRSWSPIPIALDESAYSLADVGNIIRERAADVVLLDPHQAGGLWPTIKAAAICESVGIPVTLHSGAELGISQAAYVQLAASIVNMDIAIDTERSYLGGDITAHPIKLENGSFEVPEQPGLGVDVDEELIDRYRVKEIKGAYLDDENPGWFPVKPGY